MNKAIQTPGSAELNCQLEIMEFFAGNRDKAEKQYGRASKAKTPLVRLYGQWIALLLEDTDSVDRYCRELEEQLDGLSEWERLMLDVFSKKLNEPSDVRRMAGTDRRMAACGFVSMALVHLTEANSENWEMKKRDASELLEEAMDAYVDYFGRYLAEAILDEWNHNPDCR